MNMKRFLSVLLVLSMLLVSAFTLAACKDKSKDPEKAPTYPAIKPGEVADPRAVSAAYLNALAPFFADESGASAVLDKAFKVGSVNAVLGFEGDDESGDGFRLSETIYMDAAKQAFVSETLLNAYSVFDDQLSATIWGDKSGLAFKSEGLLGSKDAYAIKFDTILKDIKGSALAELLGLTDENIDEILGFFNEMKDPANEEEAAKMAKALNDFLDAFAKLGSAPVTAETVDNTEYYVITTTIDNKTVEKMMNLVVDLVAELAGDQLSAEDILALKQTIKALQAELDASFEMSMVQKVYILPKTNTVSKTEIEMTISNKATVLDSDSDATDVSIKGVMNFSEKDITLDLDINAAGEAVGVDAKLDKKTDNGKLIYALDINVGTKNVSADLINLTLSYDKASGKVELDGDIMMDESERMEFGADATFKVTADEIAFKMISVSAMGETFTFDDKNEISVTIKALTEIPAMPADAKDIVTLTEEELADMIAGVEGSDWLGWIADSLGGIFGGTAMEDYNIHFVDELTFNLPGDYESFDVESLGYTAGFTTDEELVLVLREDAALFDNFDDITVMDYAELVLKNNGSPADEIQSEGWLTLFEYDTAEGFHYMVFLYKSEEAFWVVQHASATESFDEAMREEACGIAGSVSFDEQPVITPYAS